MNKTELLQKVTSKKFWSMLIAVISALCILFNVDANTTTQIVTVAGLFGAIVVYIYSEAKVDAARLIASANLPEEVLTAINELKALLGLAKMQGITNVSTIIKSDNTEI